MAKLFNSQSEFLVLKTLSERNNSKASGNILSCLDDTSFHTTAAKEIYKRIKTIAKKRSIIISWDDLASDPALSESTRDKITLFKKKPARSKEKVDRLVARLNEYRKLRQMFYMASNIDKRLKSSSVEADELLQESAEFITKARSNSDSSKWFTHIGRPKDGTGNSLVKKTLKVSDTAYLATGFRSYDSRSIGIPRGTFMLLGTQTSGGKSAMAGQLAEQMAEKGSKVCLVPLEMDDIEIEQRQLSRISDTPMPDILQANKLEKSAIRRIKKKYKEFADKVHKNGGVLSYFIPDDDYTMDELLLTLKPHGYDVIIIDYIGLLKGVDGDDQWRALGKATRFAKRFASTTGCAVLGFVQLNEENKIRYSKTMVEHANAAWFWKFDDMIKESGIITVEQPKSRNQQAFPFYLKHNFSIMKFISLSPREERELEQAIKMAKNTKKKSANDDDEEIKAPKKDFKDGTVKKLKFFS
jgi:replicative DNA helicase